MDQCCRTSDRETVKKVCTVFRLVWFVPMSIARVFVLIIRSFRCTKSRLVVVGMLCTRFTSSNACRTYRGFDCCVSGCMIGQTEGKAGAHCGTCQAHLDGSETHVRPRT